MRYKQEVLVRPTCSTPIKVKKPRSVVREYFDMVCTTIILRSIMVCADVYHWVEDKRKAINEDA